VITPQYAVTMAKYNTWQNSQLLDVVEVMDHGDLAQDRGAFFGSILGTLNHLLWGDLLWLARFDKARQAPEGAHLTFCADGPAWCEGRRRCDQAIEAWAHALEPGQLEGDLLWYSGALQDDFKKPMRECVVHFFNHQTHHRGQVHAMLTAAGQNAPVSDLVFMSESI